MGQGHLVISALVTSTSSSIVGSGEICCRNGSALRSLAWKNQEGCNVQGRRPRHEASKVMENIALPRFISNAIKPQYFYLLPGILPQETHGQGSHRSVMDRPVLNISHEVACSRTRTLPSTLYLLGLSLPVGKFPKPALYGADLEEVRFLNELGFC